MKMRTRFGRAIGLAAILPAALLARPTPERVPQDAAPPRLLVFVVIDQFRADYPDLYGHQWTGGLSRLFNRGAVFTQAAFDFAGTWTCAGHATIGTGTTPRTHGIPGNTFYDRALRRTLPCAFDPDAVPVAFAGETGAERLGSRALLVPTLAEELARQSAEPPAVVSIAQKPRSALMLAGRPRTGATVVWQESSGAWASSATYAKTRWPDVEAFVRARPRESVYGQEWTRILPLDRYLFSDDGVAEGRVAPRGRTFPHVIASSSGEPDGEFLRAWQYSPLNDAFVTQLAVHLLRSRGLGKDAGTDVLALSLTSLDHVGHEYGPRSHEVQDVLASLDRRLGELLGALDAQVGARYVLAFSSDHGVSFIPEQETEAGRDAGRISSSALGRTANAAVSAVLAPGEEARDDYVAASFDNQISLVPGAYEAVRRVTGGLEAVKKALADVPGIAAVWSADDILSAAGGGDAAMAAARLSYVPGRSGEFVISPRRGWVIRSSSGTTHGTLHDYDRRVPLVLYGSGIRPGRFDVAASPADIAPTLASLARITMRRAEGRVLTEAVAR